MRKSFSLCTLTLFLIVFMLNFISAAGSFDFSTNGQFKINMSYMSTDGKVVMDFLYGNGNIFQGTGGSGTKRLLSSNTNSILFDRDTDYYFTVSLVAGNRVESYALEVSDITDADPEKNVTTIRSYAADSIISKELDLGETENIGSIEIKLNAASEIDRTANLTITAQSGKIYLNRTYDASGYYVEIPTSGQINNQYSFIISAYNLTGTLVEQYKSEWEDNNAKIASNKNDCFIISSPDMTDFDVYSSVALSYCREQYGTNKKIEMENEICIYRGNQSSTLTWRWGSTVIQEYFVSCNKCIDSDNGKKYTIKGTTTTYTNGVSRVETDVCSASLLKEYHCIGTNYSLSEYTCVTGCSNGACNPQCVADWVCTTWSQCTNNKQNRTCTDDNACGTTDNFPVTSRSCNLVSNGTAENTSLTSTTQNSSGQTGVARTLPPTTNSTSRSKISNKEVSVERSSLGNYTIKIGNQDVKVSLDIVEENSKVFVKLPNGEKKEIKISFDEAKSKAKRIDKLNTLEIDEVEGKAVYVVSGKRTAFLFFIIPVKTEVEQTVEVDTGLVKSTKSPWWSFLALRI